MRLSTFPMIYSLAIHKVLIMSHKRLLAISLLLAAHLPLPAHAIGGIPTLDINSIEHLNQLMTQVETAKSQLDQAKAQLAALTQSSGFGYVLDNPDVKQQLRGSLPSNAQALLSRMENPDPNLSSAVKEVVQEVKAPVNFAQDRESLAERKVNVEATSKAMAQRAYDAMSQRLVVIDGLQGKINETTNAKEVAELQARIAIEQANIQTDQTRIQLAQQQLQAERALLDARAQRVYGGWFGSGQKP
jgi:type IV secretion system protein VirB5